MVSPDYNKVTAVFFASAQTEMPLFQLRFSRLNRIQNATKLKLLQDTAESMPYKLLARISHQSSAAADDALRPAAFS